jgi:hypothetical protein
LVINNFGHVFIYAARSSVAPPFLRASLFRHIDNDLKLALVIEGSILTVTDLKTTSDIAPNNSTVTRLRKA